MTTVAAVLLLASLGIYVAAYTETLRQAGTNGEWEWSIEPADLLARVDGAP